MKYFYLLLLASFVAANGSAQQQHGKKLVVVPPVMPGTLSDASQLNVSPLLPVRKGDVFSMRPNITFIPNHKPLLSGIFKFAGVSALSYAAARPLTTMNGKDKVQNNKLILPSLGLGLALGTPDFVKAAKKARHPYLIYTLYNRDSTLISRTVRRLDKKGSTFFVDSAKKTGFLQVSIIGDPQANFISNDLKLMFNRRPYAGLAITSLRIFNRNAENDDCMPDDPCSDPDACGFDPCDEDPSLCDPDPCASDPSACADPCEEDPTSCEPPDPCDDAAQIADPSACEIATCTPGNVDYDEGECELQNCDPTSVNYDDETCDINTCDPTSPNFNQQECDDLGCTPVDQEEVATDQANFNSSSYSSGVQLASLVFNEFFSGPLGVSPPTFNTTGLPPDASGYAADGGYLPKGGGQEFYGETDGSTIYLSPYVFSADVDRMVGMIGHEMGHYWLEQEDPADAGNTTYSEAIAYFYEGAIWSALGLTTNADNAFSLGQSYYNSLPSSLQATYRTAISGDDFPVTPPEPCTY